MHPIFDAVLGDGLPDQLRAQPELARLRIEHDHFVDAVPHWLYIGDTPLHLAAAALRTSAARELLEHGAEPNATNRRGAAPLHYACDPRPAALGTWAPDVQAELIRLLVSRGADSNYADRGGATPLHRAVRARSPAAVRALLQAGARVDTRLRARGSTPLDLTLHSTGAGGTAGAAAARDEIVAVLVEYGGLRYTQERFQPGQ